MRIVLAVFLALALCAVDQSHPFTKALFHVAAVENVDKSDFCGTTGNCLETEIQVDGYVDTPTLRVMYRLTCPELRSAETKKLISRCSTVHSNKDYMVKIFVDTRVVSFWPDTSAGDGLSGRGAFAIVSEKEVVRPNEE